MTEFMDERTKEAVEVLRGGGVILYPTDTVWGIGCDATNAAAVARVFEIKRRADSKSLVLLAGDVDMVSRYVREIPEIALRLIEVNDRPMTIVYPGALTGPGALAENVVAEDGSVGIRIPLGGFGLELTRAFRRPVVSTSANISGEATPRRFAGISDEIRSAVDFVVDPALESGATGIASSIIKVGVDSTVQIIRK